MSPSAEAISTKGGFSQGRKETFFDIVRDNVDDKDDNDKDNNDEEEDKEEWREDGNKDSKKVEGNNDDEDSVVGYAKYLINKNDKNRR